MRPLTFPLPLLAGLLVLAGCGDSDPGPAPSSLADTPAFLVRGNGGDPNSLDPLLAEDIHAFNILADLFEGLVTTDAAGRLVPGVAERWEVDDDGLTYTFFLREEARWTTGERVVAGDFVRAFERAAAPDSPSPYRGLLEPIRHFDAVTRGARPVSDLGVSAVADGELLISLERRVAYFPALLALAVASPRHHAMDDPERERDALVSNGAYELVSRRQGDSIVLARNPHFHAADDVRIERVEYLPIVNETAEANRYRAGELHLTQTVPQPLIDGLRAERPDELRIAPMLALYYLAFDLTEPPFDDPDLRKALSLAIDREAIAELLGRGEVPAYGIVPPGTGAYAAPRYDWSGAGLDARRNEAGELLRVKGYTAAEPLRITYLYDTGSTHETTALAVGAMWEAALPVEVVYESREWQHFLAGRNERDGWDVMRFSWFGDYNDPYTFLDIFRGSSEQNVPRFQDADYDAALERAAALAGSDRLSALASGEDLLLNANPIAPLYFYVSKHLVDPRLEGFEDNALDRHPSRYLSFKQL